MFENPFKNVPEINFIPTSTEKLLSEMITDYESFYEDETGEKITVQHASETKIFLNTMAYRFFQTYVIIDNGLKMNLLKYSKDDYLDNLAAWFGIKRNSSLPSYARVKFGLSAPQTQNLVIPIGTRVSTSTNIFFKTLEQTIIPPGDIAAEVNISSIDFGETTNSIDIGEINIIVDPIPFVQEVSNTTKTQGGADVESDESLRLRIYYFPDRFSTAGPENAYIYFSKTFSQAIEGITVLTPLPGHVDIRITLIGGELPEQAFLDELYDYLSAKDKRPLTDFLSIAAPDVKDYKINFKYYIANSKYSDLSKIQNDVTKAVEEYIVWQSQKIGRDVTPDVLTKLLIDAGVKRVEIIEPSFTVVSETSIAKLVGSPSIEFAGLEND